MNEWTNKQLRERTTKQMKEWMDGRAAADNSPKVLKLHALTLEKECDRYTGRTCQDSEHVPDGQVATTASSPEPFLRFV